MSDNLYHHTGLSALLDQDLSSYEYFNALPKDMQDKIEALDLSTFEEMQDYVRSQRS